MIYTADLDEIFLFPIQTNPPFSQHNRQAAPAHRDKGKPDEAASDLIEGPDVSMLRDVLRRVGKAPQDTQKSSGEQLDLMIQESSQLRILFANVPHAHAVDKSASNPMPVFPCFNSSTNALK